MFERSERNPFPTRDGTQLARVAICLLVIPGHRDMPKGSYRANYLQQSWLHFKVTCSAPEGLRGLRRRRNVMCHHFELRIERVA